MSNPLTDFIQSAGQTVLPPIQNFLKGATEPVSSNNAGMMEAAGNATIQNPAEGGIGSLVDEAGNLLGKIPGAISDTLDGLPKYDPNNQSPIPDIHATRIKNIQSVVNSGNVGDAKPYVQKQIDSYSNAFLDHPQNLQHMNYTDKINALGNMVDEQRKK